jgi:hypothetical protein
MDFKKKRGKLSGVSAPVVGGGFEWTPGTAEKDVIRSLVIDIDARRALYADSRRKERGSSVTASGRCAIGCQRRSKT